MELGRAVAPQLARGLAGDVAAPGTQIGSRPAEDHEMSLGSPRDRAETVDRPAFVRERVDLESRRGRRERRIVRQMRGGEVPDHLSSRTVEQLALPAVALAVRGYLAGPVRRRVQ